MADLQILVDEIYKDLVLLNEHGSATDHADHGHQPDEDGLDAAEDALPGPGKEIVERHLRRMQAHPKCQYASWQAQHNRFQVKKRGYPREFITLPGLNKKLRNNCDSLEEFLELRTNAFIERMDAVEDHLTDALLEEAPSCSLDEAIEQCYAEGEA